MSSDRRRPIAKGTTRSVAAVPRDMSPGSNVDTTYRTIVQPANDIEHLMMETPAGVVIPPPQDNPEAENTLKPILDKIREHSNGDLAVELMQMVHGQALSIRTAAEMLGISKTRAHRILTEAMEIARGET